MSRIGKKPIEIPKGVEVKIDGQVVTVKGSRGTLSEVIPGGVKVESDGGSLVCHGSTDTKEAKSVWGLSRALIGNMVTGVTEGFRKELEIVGVGYRAEMKGKALSIAVGFSHPVAVEPLDGVTFATEGANKIVVTGNSKEAVGRIASIIRKLRPPEPYKGKGIRYAGEHVVRKAGKAAGK